MDLKESNGIVKTSKVEENKVALLGKLQDLSSDKNTFTQALLDLIITVNSSNIVEDESKKESIDWLFGELSDLNRLI